MITKNVVQSRLVAYLNGDMSLAELVAWAEWVMFEGEIAEADFAIIRDIVARLGVADVQQFGLSWERYSNYETC